MFKSIEQDLFFRVSQRASFGWARYQMHKSQIATQYRRIFSAHLRRASIADGVDAPDTCNADAARLYFSYGKRLAQAVLAEIHLYMVAVDNGKDMMVCVLSEKEMIPLKPQLQPFVTSLEHYTHGRNTFEHFDQRLPGGKYYSRMTETREAPDSGPKISFGGFSGTHYNFGDKSWDLSQPEFARVMRGFVEFEKLVIEHLTTIDAPDS